MSQPLSPLRLWLILVVVLAVLLMASTSQAATYTETFSGPLPSFFTTYTSGNGETVTVTGGELVINIPAHTTGIYYAGIMTTFNHGVAFSEQVDYNLVTWPQWGNGASAGLTGTQNNPMYTIRTQYDDYYLGHNWHEAAQSSFHGNWGQAYLPADNRTGSLLLVLCPRINLTI